MHKVNLDSEMREIKHTFTEEEHAEMNAKFVETSKSLAVLEDERKEVMQDFKDRKKVLTDITNPLMHRIRMGYEMREVECTAEADIQNMQIVYYDETGNEVERRKMTKEERQLYLNFPKNQAVNE